MVVVTIITVIVAVAVAIALLEHTDFGKYLNCKEFNNHLECMRMSEPKKCDGINVCVRACMRESERMTE